MSELRSSPEQILCFVFKLPGICSSLLERRQRQGFYHPISCILCASKQLCLGAGGWLFHVRILKAVQLHGRKVGWWCSFMALSGRRCLWHKRLPWWETGGGLAEHEGASPSLPPLQYPALLWEPDLRQRMQWVPLSLQTVGTLCQITPVSVFLPSILYTPTIPFNKWTGGWSLSCFSFCFLGMNAR